MRSIGQFIIRIIVSILLAIAGLSMFFMFVIGGLFLVIGLIALAFAEELTTAYL